MKKLIGISTWTLQELYGDRGAIEIAARIGADSVDMSTFFFGNPILDYRNPDSLYSRGDEAVVEYYRELREYAEGLGIVIGQTHGRGEGFVGNKEEDDAQVENARLDLLAAAALGAPVCVIHSPTSIYHGADPDPEYMHRLNFDQYNRMLPYAAEYGVDIATETFGDAPKLGCIDFFGDLGHFIRGYDSIYEASPYRDRFKVCMDTGHTNKAGRFGCPKAPETIRLLGDRITALHLNDNDTFKDQHKIPRSGTVDWTDTMTALDEIGYSGIYNMEVNLKCFGVGLEIETAEFAVKVMKNMLDGR